MIFYYFVWHYNTIYYFILLKEILCIIVLYINFFVNELEFSDTHNLSISIIHDSINRFTKVNYSYDIQKFMLWEIVLVLPIKMIDNVFLQNISLQFCNIIKSWSMNILYRYFNMLNKFLTFHKNLLLKIFAFNLKINIILYKI